MKLWRPVGFTELGLIYDLKMRGFPPRLPEQPIFYPVLNSDYAVQIARDWNTQEPTGAGYVTEFDLPDSFISQFERKIVGGSEHEEFWIPADRVAELNQLLLQPINVVAGFFHKDFRGLIPEKFGLAGKTATEQFNALVPHLSYSSFDVWCETAANAKAVFMNFLFWQNGCSPEGRELTESERKLIEFVQHRWREMKCGFDLPGKMKM